MATYIAGDHKFNIMISQSFSSVPLERKKHTKLSKANVQTSIIYLYSTHTYTHTHTHLRRTRQSPFKTSIMGMLLTKINFSEKTAKKKFNILIYMI